MIQFLIAFISTWIAVCVTDLIFKTCLLHPYIQALEMTGCSIKPFYLKCYLTQFNRCLSRWGRASPKFFRRWFDVGAVVTCVLIIPAIGLLLMSAIQLIFAKEQSQGDSQILQPVVPGFNLPMSQIVYYLITLFLCSTFHELGHALAAVREGVQVEGCGFFIVLIIPAAFVDLRKEQLLNSSPWQLLRIFSAGIWHNVVLAFCAFLLLWCNPHLLSPLFSHQKGVSVIHISPGSGASGPAGLFPGDQIHAVNSCRVDHMDAWKTCLQGVALNSQHGYCASKLFLAEYEITYELENQKDFCRNSSSHLCFRFEDKSRQAHLCLPVRKLMTNNQMCMHDAHCHDKDEICVVPLLDSKAERLIKIERYQKDPVLYLGSASELFASVTISPWVPKFTFISAYVVYVYETLLKYLISFSAALAMLNLIPCPGLDGQWIAQTLADSLLSSVLPERFQRAAIVLILKIFGCTLIVANVVLGLYKLFYIR